MALTGLLAVVAPPSSAQDEGVILDPSSPSGREYTIPLESARRGADPRRSGSDEVVQGSRSAVPFGEGIEPATAPSAATAPAGEEGSGGGKRERRDPKGAAGSKGGSLPPEVLSAAARPPVPDGGFGSLGLYGVGGLLVVAAGALGGVLYRRRSAG